MQVSGIILWVIAGASLFALIKFFLQGIVTRQDIDPWKRQPDYWQVHALGWGLGLAAVGIVADMLGNGEVFTWSFYYQHLWLLFLPYVFLAVFQTTLAGRWPGWGTVGRWVIMAAAWAVLGYPAMVCVTIGLSIWLIINASHFISESFSEIDKAMKAAFPSNVPEP